MYIMMLNYFTINISGRLINEYRWIITSLRYDAISLILTSQINSYLGTSGGLWILMLPIVFLNFSKNKK